MRVHVCIHPSVCMCVCVCDVQRSRRLCISPCDSGDAPHMSGLTQGTWPPSLPSCCPFTPSLPLHYYILPTAICHLCSAIYNIPSQSSSNMPHDLVPIGITCSLSFMTADGLKHWIGLQPIPIPQYQNRFQYPWCSPRLFNSDPTRSGACWFCVLPDN